MRPLGEVLADDGDLTIRRLRRASEYQKRHGGSIESALLAIGAMTEETLTAALSRASGLPPVGRERLLSAEAAVVESLPADARRRLRAIPFDWCGVRLSVAVSDPGNTVLETGLVAATGYDVELYVLADPALEECLVEWERRESGAPAPAPPVEEAAPEADSEPVERLARALLAEAVRHEALALELGGDALSSWARTLHFKIPPMTRRFDARLLTPLLGWFFARAGVEGSFALHGKDGSEVKRVVVEQTPAGLTLHFRDAQEHPSPAIGAPPPAPVTAPSAPATPASSEGCGHEATPGDVFCPTCGATL